MRSRTWNINEVSPAIVSATRHEFARALQEIGYSHAAVEAGTLILGELLANACEHGVVPVHIELRSVGSRWRLTVGDAGCGITRPLMRDPNSLRGRGFEIIERLGAKLNIAPPPRSSVEVFLPEG